MASSPGRSTASSLLAGAETTRSSRRGNPVTWHRIPLDEYSDIIDGVNKCVPCCRLWCVMSPTLMAWPRDRSIISFGCGSGDTVQDRVRLASLTTMIRQRPPLSVSDLAPTLFARIRGLYGIQPADFIESLGQVRVLSVARVVARRMGDDTSPCRS